jgi:hypothetical protein
MAFYDKGDGDVLAEHVGRSRVLSRDASLLNTHVVASGH